VIASVLFNSILNILSAAVAFAVSYYAYKSNRLVGSQLLRFICVGFLLLGVGLATEGLTQALVGFTPVQVARFTGLEGLVFVLDVVLQLFAYVTFAWGYAVGAFGKGKELQAAAFILPTAAATRLLRFLVFSLDIFVLAQLGIVVLMLFVVVEGVFVYSRNRSGLALSVLSGFILILVAHVLLFVSVIYLSADIYLLGTFVQFMGFCALLYFLYRSSHVGTI
jgi:hypothetical protein